MSQRGASVILKSIEKTSVIDQRGTVPNFNFRDIAYIKHW
jgi:hypothetical protein